MTIIEAARQVGLTDRTLKNYLRSGDIRPAKVYCSTGKQGWRWDFDEADLDAIRRVRRVKAENSPRAKKLLEGKDA